MDLSQDKTNHIYFQKAVSASLGSEYVTSHGNISQSHCINSFGNDIFYFLFFLIQVLLATSSCMSLFGSQFCFYPRIVTWCFEIDVPVCGTGAAPIYLSELLESWADL